ncbi:MAG: hypothetical protein WCD76_09515 [Pyrinomonadaceae bacterium]
MILLLALFVTGCAKSPSDELKAEMQTVSSWAGTAQMVGEEWTRSTVTAAYARRTLETAVEAFEQETKALNELSVASPELRAEWLTRLEKLKQSTMQMQQGIEQGDRGRVVEEIERLKMENQAIQTSLQSSSGGQQQ